jgi:hypothetical protein
MGNQQERWEVNAARLAMLLDTDGCISMRVLQRAKTRVANLRPEISAVGTYFSLIEWASSTLKEMGVPHHVQTVDWSKYTWSRSRLPQKRLTVIGLMRVNKLIPIVLPYLIAKTQQGHLLKEFIESRLAQPHKAEYTDRDLEIANKIRSLNSNKGGAWRPISSESIRATREMREHLSEKMCSDLTRDRESVVETSTPAE